MKKFIDNLLVIKKGKHVHTFCTQMAYSGDGAWCYHKNFEKKGLIIDSTVHFIMPSNLSVFKRFLAPAKNIKKINRIMDKCEKHIESYIEELMTGQTSLVGKHSYLLGILQRGPYRLFYKRFQNLLSIDEARCTKCGLCASLCSSNNIKMKVYPKFAGECSQCLRCYAFCPNSAIRVYGKSRNVEKTGKPYTLHDSRFKPDMLK